MVFVSLPARAKRLILARIEAAGYRVTKLEATQFVSRFQGQTNLALNVSRPTRPSEATKNSNSAEVREPTGSANLAGTVDLSGYKDIFSGIHPWEGQVPKGFIVDFLGTLTDCQFQAALGIDPADFGERHIRTSFPGIGDGTNAEGWFEAVNWIVAAREARDRFVMMTLGACFGAQIVGGYRTLQMLNPVPAKLVAIEPVPENYQWTIQHLQDNGIDPADHWLLPTVITDRNEPVFFPVGAPGTGAQNCYSTDHLAARRHYLEEFIKTGQTEEALRNLLLHNTTGLQKQLTQGHAFSGEIRLVSSMTLKDLLGPFDFVDYIESDIQQSEILVFPPFMDLLKRKVRRIHIGTHGQEVHETLHRLFVQNGWEIIFSLKPNSRYDSLFGPFVTNDGVLTVRNPRV